jgi:putative membrane protein insertion efficiency factor
VSDRELATAAGRGGIPAGHRNESKGRGFGGEKPGPADDAGGLSSPAREPVGSGGAGAGRPSIPCDEEFRDCLSRSEALFPGVRALANAGSRGCSLIMRRVLVMLVHGYRWILSPLKVGLLGPGARCRFEPSCSEYAVQAITCHGAWSGSLLAVRRICRCHPWGGCGYDPVPSRPAGRHPGVSEAEGRMPGQCPDRTAA